MKRFPWTRGSDSAHGAVYVSATRFEYRTFRVMPSVLWNGLRLTRRWPTIEGAIAVCTALELPARTTYSVSVWRDEAHLARWLASDSHAPLVRRYRRQLESTRAAGWWTDAFDREAAWVEAMTRLHRPAPHATPVPQRGAIGS